MSPARHLPHGRQGNIAFLCPRLPVGIGLAFECRGKRGSIGAVEPQTLQHASKEMRLEGSEGDPAVRGLIDVVAGKTAAEHSALGREPMAQWTVQRMGGIFERYFVKVTRS